MLLCLLAGGDRWYAADTPNRAMQVTLYTAAASLAGWVGPSATSARPAIAAAGKAAA
jgi:hypothetical protein